MEKLVCVFCEGIFPAETFVCPDCNEYKGMMTITEASETYDFLEYLKEEN
jgi:RNA polymerase subunit RPABC4/transcription elongation factor Spt4